MAYFNQKNPVVFQFLQ